jgi:hypothetical protein
MKKCGPSPIFVDTVNWSEQSRRSLKYISAPTQYHDIEYTCYHCRRIAVYSAAAQRESLEVKKAYLWQHRVLCEQCFLARRAFEKEIRGLNSRWLIERNLLEKEPKSLIRWLQILKDLPSYGVRKNTAHIAMLTKLLENAH